MVMQIKLLVLLLLKDQVCDQFQNMVISGDSNLPNISCHSVDSASGVNELPFIEASHDHFLILI